MRRLTTLAFSLVTLACLAMPSGAETPVAEPDPEAYLQRLMGNPRLRSTGTGEHFCWHAASGANDFLDAYEAFGNPEWLAAAEKYYAFYISKLRKDPDGYEGWIGDPVSQNNAELHTDAVVGDAILCEPLTRFAWIVLKQNPGLKRHFGQTAAKYVKLATRICWDKWNHRGCYYEDQAGWGSYHTYGKLVDPKRNRWVDAPTRVISNNLNKHYSVCHVLLRLWRITGKAEYKERVKSVFGRAKTMWRWHPDQDRVVWNFWMPHGPYDLEGRAPKSWVAVHPNRAGYQAGEVADWVEVYDSGLVFDRADLERIIRTNHWMMPGDGRSGWRNADGTSDAGTLWTALARFDERIRDAYEARLRAKDTPPNRIRLAYLKNVIEKRLGWKRLYCPDESDAEVVEVPLQAGRNITMSIVVPNAVEVAASAPVQLACQTRTEGTLKIELLDEPGGDVLGTLAEMEVSSGGKSEFNAPFWDGTNPKTGEKTLGQYTVRWSLAGESRTQPVFVVHGKPRQRSQTLLSAGETITESFESRLDRRWKLDRAGPTTRKAHAGRRSLEVKGVAELVFGKYEDLPVRISMWVYDAGAKFGKDGANGPAWGVRTALGDKFAIRQVWRPYLAGDREYSWLNTGEGQWFSPHPCGVPRKPGWSRWVFDFSDPSNVKLTGDGKPGRRLTAKYTPQGAVSVYLMAGRQAGPFYVDDVQVEYARP